jgi:hypothetical protein
MEDFDFDTHLEEQYIILIDVVIITQYSLK